MSENQRDEMMKAWMAAGTPGEEHRWLERLVGRWDILGRNWLEGPEGPVSESRGEVEARWLIPNLWVQDVVKSEMMGAPFLGVGIMGYDNTKKKFVGSWVDGMSTGLLTMEGTLDPDGKTLVMFGTANDPASGRHDQLMGYITRFRDHDHHTFEIRDYSTDPAGVKTMELEYTRRE